MMIINGYYRAICVQSLPLGALFDSDGQHWCTSDFFKYRYLFKSASIFRFHEVFIRTNNILLNELHISMMINNSMKNFRYLIVSPPVLDLKVP